MGNIGFQKKFMLIPILLLAATLSYVFFYGPTLIAASDNYRYAEYAYYFLTSGFHGLPLWDIFTSKYIILMGIALTYKLLGVGIFSATVFGVAAFLLTIIVVYRIGSLLLDENAGILSAFFYSILPAVVINSSNVGDTVPMALFVSIAIMFLLMGFKSENWRDARLCYAASGFFAVIGDIVSPEATMVLIPIAILLVIIVGRRAASISLSRFRMFSKDVGSRHTLFGSMWKVRGADMFMLFAGIVLALLVMAGLGILQSGNPDFIFNVTSHCLSTPSCTPVSGFSVAPFENYMTWLFPHSLISNTYTFLESGSLGGIGTFIRRIIALPPGNSDFNNWALYYFGFFGYFAVLGAVYLAIKRDSSVVVPAVWLVSTLLYLSLGTISLEHYYFRLPFTNYMLVFAPALALILGLAFERMLLESKKGRRGTLALAFAVVLFMVLLFSSINQIESLQYSQYNWVYPLLQVSSYTQHLPTGSSVDIWDNIPMDIYVNYTTVSKTGKIDYYYYSTEDCSSIPNGTYLVAYANQSWASSCGLSLLYESETPKWLASYTLFGNNFANLSVYREGSLTPP